MRGRKTLFQMSANDEGLGRSLARATEIKNPKKWGNLAFQNSAGYGLSRRLAESCAFSRHLGRFADWPMGRELWSATVTAVLGCNERARRVRADGEMLVVLGPRH